MARQIRKPTAAERTRKTGERIRKKEIENIPAPSAGSALAVCTMQAYNSALTVTPGSTGDITWTQTIFDSTAGGAPFTNGTMWNGTTGLVAPVDGLYEIAVVGLLAPIASQSDEIVAQLRIVGGHYLDFDQIIRPPGSGNALTFKLLGRDWLTAGDVVIAEISNDSSVSVSLNTGTGGVGQISSGGPVATMKQLA